MASGSAIPAQALESRFRITHPPDKTLVAMAKRGRVFDNYKSSAVVSWPNEFRTKFPRANQID